MFNQPIDNPQRLPLSTIVQQLFDNTLHALAIELPDEMHIKFRLNSGRKLYIERGGKLGRKVGTVKTIEQKKEQYKDVISYLKRGYSVRTIAKLTNKRTSTVQRIKKGFNL